MGLPVVMAGIGIAASLGGTAASVVQSSAARKQQRKQQHLADLAAREAKQKERAEVENRNRTRQRLGAGSGKGTILGGESQTEIGRNVLLGQ
jgi:hypothetical protein